MVPAFAVRALAREAGEQGHRAGSSDGAAGPFTPGTVGTEVSLGLDHTVSQGLGARGGRGWGGGTVAGRDTQCRVVSTWATPGGTP